LQNLSSFAKKSGKIANALYINESRTTGTIDVALKATFYQLNYVLLPLIDFCPFAFATFGVAARG
jgi:hypothetical protein